MNGRKRILGLLEGKPLDCLPVMPITMMFAADRIGRKYREYATDFRVLAEAQLKTAELFDFDHVSVISDPAREAADLGADIEWFDDQPPAFVERNALLSEKTALRRLQVPDPRSGGRMHDRLRAISLLRQETGTERLVEGWIEGPVAQAANLRGINTLMFDLHDDPEFVRDLFAFVLEMELRFAEEQISAGAEIIGIGDAAASLIGPACYAELAYPFEKELIAGVRRLGARVRLHICGRTRRILPWITRSGADILDLDWMVPIREARAIAGPGLVLLGNIDPVEVVRNGTPEQVEQRLAICHEEAGPSYIVGAGCEIVRDTPPENVRSMVRYARSRRQDNGRHPA